MKNNGLYSHTNLFGGALKGLIRLSVCLCGLLGLFFVIISLVFSLVPKIDLLKIRVPGTWPYKNNGLGTHLFTFTHFSNGLFIPKTKVFGSPFPQALTPRTRY